jgi:predicted restriction endonuclease
MTALLPCITALSTSQLGEQITLLAGQINAANYQLLKLIAVFDQKEGWAEHGVKSCAHWLNWQCGIALGAAREKIRVAHALEQLPATNKAFARGELSYSKVRAMTRVATNENEDFLLTIAEHGTASHMEQVVKKYQRVERSAEQKHAQLKKLVSYVDDDGMYVIHARLPAEEGEQVVNAIEAVISNEQADTQAEDVSAETLHETYEVKRADALAKMAEHYLATSTRGSQPLAGHERYQLVLYHRLQPSEMSSIMMDSQISRIACDASIRNLDVNQHGQVVSIGRKSRVVPQTMRRALEARDTTCRHPACCATNYLDAHHIVHWVDGGETRLDNLVLLCRHHHRALHNGEFVIEMHGNQPMFKSVAGKSLHAKHSNCCSDNTIVHWSMRWPDVSAETSKSKWRGEQIDYDLVVGHLQNSARIAAFPDST